VCTVRVMNIYSLHSMLSESRPFNLSVCCLLPSSTLITMSDQNRRPVAREMKRNGDVADSSPLVCNQNLKYLDIKYVDILI
jgi:hypothetical protein